MAKKEATLLIKVKQTGTKAFKSTLGFLTSLKGAIAGVAFGVITKQIGELALEADKFNDVERAFRGLAESQGEDAAKMLSSMRDLSKGTIDDLTLMQKANQALLLGLPVDKFGDMLKIARSSSKATGESMEFMLNSIVTGLGRGSKLILDNLGIMIDTNAAQEEYALKLGRTAASLSEAEKKQAFINKALEIGVKNAEKSGAGADSLTDSWARMQAVAKNMSITVGKKLIPFFKTLADTLSDLPTVLNEVRKSFGGVDAQYESSAKSAKTLRLEQVILESEILSLQKTVDDFHRKGNVGKILAGLSGKSVTGAVLRIAALKEKHKEFAKAIVDSEKRQREAIKKTSEIKAEIAAAEEERLIKEREDKLLMQEENVTQKAKEVETEALFQEAMKNTKLQAQMKEINGQIKNETDRQKKLDLIRQKTAIKEKAAIEEKKRQETGLFQFQQLLNSQKVSNASAVFGQIATLSQSHNKKLAAIGKAAGIANAIINTARGVTLALATFPPPLSFALAGAVGAAGAAQVATIAGVQLAEGGIVKASEGGTRATIGEGGQDEAVIPLDESGGFGGGINITVYGGLLGDESSARDFAKAIDEELLKLRQSNESVAFDEVVI